RFARASADLENAVFLLEILEAGDAADVHQMSGGAEPELQQWQEALSAGEDLGLAALGAVAPQESHRLLEGLGCMVVERCGDHRSHSPFRDPGLLVTQQPIDEQGEDDDNDPEDRALQRAECRTAGRLRADRADVEDVLFGRWRRRGRGRCGKGRCGWRWSGRARRWSRWARWDYRGRTRYRRRSFRRGRRNVRDRGGCRGGFELPA